MNPRLYSGQIVTAARTFLVGAVVTAIFLGKSLELPAQITPAMLLVAVAATVAGLRLGFRLAAEPGVRHLISRIDAHHYSMAAAVGFVFGGMWAYEGGATWPLVAWFGPAALLESFASSVVAARAKHAS
jgi:hypothetical protein